MYNTFLFFLDSTRSIQIVIKTRRRSSNDFIFYVFFTFFTFYVEISLYISFSKYGWMMIESHYWMIKFMKILKIHWMSTSSKMSGECAIRTKCFVKKFVLWASWFYCFCSYCMKIKKLAPDPDFTQIISDYRQSGKNRRQIVWK